LDFNIDRLIFVEMINATQQEWGDRRGGLIDGTIDRLCTCMHVFTFWWGKSCESTSLGGFIMAWGAPGSRNSARGYMANCGTRGGFEGDKGGVFVLSRLQTYPHPFINILTVKQPVQLPVHLRLGQTTSLRLPFHACTSRGALDKVLGIGLLKIDPTLPASDSVNNMC